MHWHGKHVQNVFYVHDYLSTLYITLFNPHKDPEAGTIIFLILRDEETEAQRG